jgi:uncharacterized coiled-coil protein SlyX
VITAALIREVTQNFGDMMEEKLSKFTETLEKISTTLESQSKRITEAEQRVSDVEDTVTGLQGRLAEAEKKIKLMADGMDDMENRSRRDNICVLNLKEGTEGKTLSTSSKLGCLPCLVWKRLPALKAASKLTGRTGAWSRGVCVPAR